MMYLMENWQRFCLFLQARYGEDAERGASLVEYALLVALIAVVCIVAIQFLGHSASSAFNSVGSQITP
jgi:Flp pilus assembly pilin Flp